MTLLRLAITLVVANMFPYAALVPGTAIATTAAAPHDPITPVAKRICRTVRAHGKKVRTCHIDKPPILPIISRGLPAYASRNIYAGTSARFANDGDFGTAYRSAGLPAWVAYDLSSVPKRHRTKVLAVYYNPSYGYSTIHGSHYNNLADYTIEGNAAPGGGSPPDTGWMPLISVTGNTLHSRQHILDLRGFTWVRINITSSDGSLYNHDAGISEFDLYDLGSLPGVFDDWIFFGDSITAGSMVTYPQNGVDSFATLIRQGDPSRWPVAENGGEPFDSSANAVTRILGTFSAHSATGYLSIFPGKYVVLSYGMNDAAASSDGSKYFHNMQRLVEAILTAGKVPVIPKISYTDNARHNANIPTLNARIDQLYGEYPRIVKGPDFWAFFQRHPDLIRSKDIHPTSVGFAAMRKLWASTMLHNVYGVRSSDAP